MKYTYLVEYYHRRGFSVSAIVSCLFMFHKTVGFKYFELHKFVYKDTQRLESVGYSPSPFGGLTVDAAMEKSIMEGKVWRIVRLGKVDLMVASDYDGERLNFWVKEGKVDIVTKG